MILRTPRFEKKPDPLFKKINTSLDFDLELLDHDIKQSKAHAKGLLAAKIISREEYEIIVNGLAQISEHWYKKEEDEDVHMLIERMLTEKIGEAGAKIHTARSRNDQVATDLRLFLKDNIGNNLLRIEELQQTLIDISERNIDLIVPGYTHLQRAQPILLSHHLLAYFFMLARDYQRFSDCLKRLDVLPAGSGAIAGVSYEIDRELIAKELGFARVSENSLDAVSDRDFAIEYLSCASILAVHMSRLAEEITIWNSSEFNFIEIDDSFASGSSIMPQKKNPDAAELIRGKCGRLFGNLIALLTTMKGLPLTYNKDLQEDKEPIFDATKTLDLVLPAMEGLLRAISFNKEAMRSAAEGGFMAATDVADYLVRKGIPFRKAHEIVSALVKSCIGSKRDFEDLTLEELKAVDSAFDQDFYQVIKLENVINSKISTGGTAKFRVEEEIQLAREKLKKISAPIPDPTSI